MTWQHTEREQEGERDRERGGGGEKWNKTSNEARKKGKRETAVASGEAGITAYPGWITGGDNASSSD